MLVNIPYMEHMGYMIYTYIYKEVDELHSLLNPARSFGSPSYLHHKVQKAAKNALRSLRRQGISPEAMDNPWGLGSTRWIFHYFPF